MALENKETAIKPCQQKNRWFHRFKKTTHLLWMLRSTGRKIGAV
jgi:hypothetical protein